MRHRHGFAAQDLHVAEVFTDQQAMIRFYDSHKSVRTLDVKKFQRNVRAGGTSIPVTVVVARFKRRAMAS
jgi:hypothetical protein